MAKVVLHVTLVNGTDFAPREVGAIELRSRLVGHDIRPPVEGIYLRIYTDDGHVVSLGVPPDGDGEITASVRDWDGAE